MSQLHILTWLLAVFLMAAQPASAASLGCDAPDTIRFSFIPKSDPALLKESYRPLIARLETALERKVEIVTPSSYTSVVEGLLSGAVDIAELGPASYAIAKRRDPRITAFATYTTRKGPFTEPGAFYTSLLIVRSASPYAGIAGLRGKTLNLSDPASTSGAIIPRFVFQQQQKLALDTWFSRIRYSGSHSRSIDAVLTGKDDAAFVASVRLDQAVRDGRLHPEEVRVLWQSDPIPNDPIVMRGRLCAPIKSAIRKAFLDRPTAMASQAGANTEYFTETIDDDYAMIKMMFKESP